MSLLAASVIVLAAATVALAGGIAGWRTARRLARPAHRDALTGAGNRAAFDAALAHAAARHRPIAVVLLNLDSTRTLVRRVGHRALEQLLVLTAGRVQQVAASAGGVVFRLRRDELAVLLPRLDPGRAAAIAARLVAAVAEPTELQLGTSTVTVTVTAGAGVATFAPHTDGDRQLLLIRADRAVRTAKQHGRGRHAVFDPAMLRDPAGPTCCGEAR